MDSAKFTLILRDQFSKPANAASRSVEGLTKSMRGANSAAARGQKMMRQRQREALKAARHLAAAQRKAAGISRTVNAGLMQNAQATNESANALFRRAGLVAGVAAAAGAFAVMAGSAVLAKVAIDRVSHTENAVYALDRLTHHGQQSFNEIRGLATQLGLDIDETAHSYINFLKLQFPEAEAKKYIKLGADMRALGNSADDVQGIFRAIGQIKSKGRLQAEEMLQLAERGVSQILIKKQIAQAMGIAESEVEKAQQQGKVTWDIAGPAIQRALNQKLGQTEAGEAGMKFAQATIDGATSVMKQKATGMWIDLAEQAKPGIKSGLGTAATAFDKLLGDTNTQAQLKRFMADFGSGLQTVFEYVSQALPIVVSIFTEFIGGFRTGTGEASAMKTSLELMIDALTGIRDMARGVGEVFGTIAGFVEKIRSGMQAIASFGGGVADYLLIGTSVDKEKQMAADARAAMEQQRGTKGSLEHLRGAQSALEYANGFVKGLYESQGMVYEAGASVARAADSGVRTQAQIHSPSRLMEKRGEMMSRGFADGMQGAAPSGGEMLGGMYQTGGIMKASGRAGGINVGGITINVSGTGDARETAQATFDTFERQFGAMLSRYSEEVAA